MRIWLTLTRNAALVMLAIVALIAVSIVARASGGVTLFTNPATTTGVSLAAGGGSWNTLSDPTARHV